MFITEGSDLCFQVHSWKPNWNGIYETISASSNALIAIAAYEKAVELYPNLWLTVRHGTRTIHEHIPPKKRAAP